MTGSQPLAESRAKILLVDDRPENLAALESVLEPLGEETVCARSGRDALRHLLRQDFALILMDAHMPILDGFETAAIIRERERSRHIPIIFVTAENKDTRSEFKSYSVGAVDFITKPFDPDIMRSKVRVFVELHKKNEQIQRQAELIHRIELREAAEAMQREHMERLNSELELNVQARTIELREANQELEAFCYSVSHDLRAPLRAIIATSRILLEDAGSKLESEERSLLIRQATAANRLGALIDDLLMLSRLGRSNLDRIEIDLSELAWEIANDILSRNSECNAQFDIEPNLRVHADPGLVRVLMNNLLENACKYSPNGGTVTVGSETREGKTVMFVKDEGIGFDMKYAQKLFLPFERLHRDDQYEGTGIGLASVHRIVSRHGGDVWAHSQPNQGATFFFTLL